MLKSLGKALLQLRIGGRLFICVSNRHFGRDLRATIRPLDLGWFSCWCERPQVD